MQISNKHLEQVVNKNSILPNLIITMNNHETIRERNNKRLGWASAITGIVFGLLITFIGIAVFKKDNFGIVNLQKWTADRDNILMQIFGVICIVYGLFRLYRAYDKLKNG